jgi:mono/diheme cytochrome c family protein
MQLKISMRRAAPALTLTVALAPLVVSSIAHAVDATAPRYSDGATVFQANCAVCHGPQGGGAPSLAPPLTSYPARYAADPEGRRQLAMTVLYGLFGDVVVDQQHYNFKMPDFTRLDDKTLAAVLNFVVFDLGHAPDSTKPLASEEIAAERSHPVEGAAVREHRTKLLAAFGL